MWVRVVELVVVCALVATLFQLFNEDSPNSPFPNQILQKWSLVPKGRSFHSTAVDLPTSNCTATTSSTLNAITGSCAFLNNQNGCCVGSVTIGSIPADCSATCQSSVYAAYCALKCIPTTAKSGNKVVVCRDAVDRLWSQCGSCLPFGSAITTQAQFLNGSNLVLPDTDASACFNFTAYEIISTNPPVIVNVSASATSVNADTAAGTPITLTLYATSQSPVLSGSISICSPVSTGGLQTWSATTAAATLSNFVLVDAANNLYAATATWSPNYYQASGAYTVCNATAVNSAGLTYRADSSTLTITVNATFTGNSYGTLSLCQSGAAGGDALTPQVCKADALNFCCTGSCALSSNPSVCTSFEVATISLTAPSTVFSGSLATRVTGTFTVASTVTTININQGASLVILGVMTIGTPLTIQNDNNDKSIFQIEASGRLVVTAAVKLATIIVLLGTATISAGSITVTNSFLMTADTSTLNADGGNLVLSTETARCSAGAIKSTTPATFGLKVNGGTYQQTSSCSLTALLAASFISVSSTSRQLLATTAPVVRSCSTLGGTSGNFGSNAVLEVLTCSTATGCTCTTATSTQPAIALTVNGDLTMQRGSNLKFTEVGGTSFGVLSITGVARFEDGANILVFLSSTLTASATKIRLLQYQQAADGTCNLPSTVSLGTPITTNRKWDKVTESVTDLGLTFCALSLDLGTTPPASGVQTQNFQFSSVDVYTLTLNQDCKLFGATEFKSAFTVATVTGRGMLSTDQISVRTTTCGSVVVTFACSSSVSPQDADDLCKQVVADATNSNTPLYNQLRGISGGATSTKTSGSPSSLYALLGLCILPFLCIIAFVLYYRNSQRTADNQYMEDTARFSNVAASPQPLRQFNGVPPLYAAGPGFQPVAGYDPNYPAKVGPY